MRRKLFNMPEAELAAQIPTYLPYLTPLPLTFRKWHMSSDINFASNAVVAQTNKAQMEKKEKEGEQRRNKECGRFGAEIIYR